MKRKIIYIICFICILAGGIIFYNRPMDNIDYIKKNSRDLKLNDINDNNDLDLIWEDIKDKSVIFTNETHGVKENTDIQYKFINYLMDNWDLKYFLMECGHASGLIFNKYLQSGDEKLLDDIFQWGIVGKMNTESTKALMKKLYLKNKDLPEEKQLTIVGLDVMEGVEGVTYYFKNILEKYKEMPKEQLDKMRKILECSEEEDTIGEKSSKFSKAIEDLEKDLKVNEDIYAKYLDGEEIFNLKLIVNNLKNSSKLGYTIDGGITVNKELYEARDKVNYENFKKIFEHFGGGKYYCHYGIDHVYQNEINNVKFLGANIKEDPNFKDQIYSINTIYKEGQCYNYSDLSPMHFYSITTELENILKDAGIENGNKIIVLDAKKSPYKKNIFKECFSFLDVYVDEKLFEANKGATTDYFQSIIVIENPTPIKWLYWEDLMKGNIK
ncbi:erythromycin esterase family protein [Clostridium sp. UBA6640]|uniref:erythromycin esterase family protein n=1 Tax=Clostridium sp. UBA6640 TaxID=1946370 RepID=UPI0025C04679|nr:erythromycin esterase family protein [Clostridium sp. UBA6640]